MPSFLTNIKPAEVRSRLAQPAYAQAVADALTGPLPGGCGRQKNKDHETLCRVRLVLEALGILKKGYYAFAGKSKDGKAGIALLQRALGVVAEGIWGPSVNGALSQAVRATLGVPYDTSRTDRPWVVAPGGGGRKAPPPPPPPPQPPPGPLPPVVDNGGNGGGMMLRAGIPLLLLGGAVVSWLMFRKGKKTGLAGCDCGMGAFDDRSEAGEDEDWEDDDEGEPGNDEAESARAVRSIPQFPAARAA